MSYITISINQEAYNFLKSLKAKDESFSDVIFKFKEKKGSKEAIMKYFGVLKDKGIDWNEKEKRMKEFRGEVDSRFEETAKYMEEARRVKFG